MIWDRKASNYNQSLSKDLVLCKRILRYLREFKLDFGKDTSHVMKQPGLCQISWRWMLPTFVFMATYSRTRQIIKQMLPWIQIQNVTGPWEPSPFRQGEVGHVLNPNTSSAYKLSWIKKWQWETWWHGKYISRVYDEKWRVSSQKASQMFININLSQTT